MGQGYDLTCQRKKDNGWPLGATVKQISGVDCATGGQNSLIKQHGCVHACQGKEDTAGCGKAAVKWGCRNGLGLTL